jgi:hypothetical protein
MRNQTLALVLFASLFVGCLTPTDGKTDDTGEADADGGSSSVGACVLGGVCYDGIAYGECMGFGGTDWYADGCP